jgi:K(+)-stimulated pyrophosphate-energized sodium pump
MEKFIYFSVLVSIAAFLFAGWLYFWVKKQPSSNKRVEEIGKLIREGANTFLRKEYKILAIFSGVVAVILFLFLPSPIWKGKFGPNLIMALSYIAGTVFSATAGKIGIQVSTIANVKSAEAAKNGLKPSFMAGFRGGAIMGMAVVGGSLLGVSAVMLVTGDTTALLGFSFGASSLALFAKAGGGIFTKTADISANLVGKVELGIPEDDPPNPAVIADNVGDNVGDCAGMGADLFDSNVASMAAALVMGVAIDKATNSSVNAAMVFCFAALGLVASIIGVATARIGKHGNPTRALNSGTYSTTLIYIVLTAVATYVFDFNWSIWAACIIGLLVGVIIGITSDYFTNDNKKPVQFVAKASNSGPAFTVLSGVSYGMLSVLPELIGIAVAALAAFKLCAPIG